MRINKIMIKMLFAIVIIGMILGNLGIVKAATTGTVTFTPSSQTVKEGDTVTVIMAGTCDKGIGGVEAKYSFDSTKLELVKEEVISTKWTYLPGTSGLITVLPASLEEKITSGDIYKLEFKVKNGVEVNSNIEINFTDIKLLTDEDNPQDVEVPTTQTVTLTVKANDPTPMETPTQTPSTTPTPTTSGSSNGRELIIHTDDDNTTNTSSKNASSNTSKSGASVLPYTGMSSFIIIGLGLVVIASVGLYFANRRYRGI